MLIPYESLGIDKLYMIIPYEFHGIDRTIVISMTSLRGYLDESLGIDKLYMIISYEFQKTNPLEYKSSIVSNTSISPPQGT